MNKKDFFREFDMLKKESEGLLKSNKLLSEKKNNLF